MQSMWTWMLAALFLIAGPMTFGVPLAAQSGATTEAQSAPAFDASAQNRRRPPARIIVRPRPRGHLDPRAVRHCTSWLEPEYRPSGTVIVPQMRCWWAPPG